MAIRSVSFILHECKDVCNMTVFTYKTWRIRLYIITLILSLILSLWAVVYLVGENHIRRIRWYKHDQYNKRRCIVDIPKSRDLLMKTIVALEDVGVRPAVCHGTLFGILRHGDIQADDDTVDLCLTTRELYRKKVGGWHVVKESLNKAGLEVSGYDSWMGLYRISQSTSEDKSNAKELLNLRVFKTCIQRYGDQRQKTLDEYWNEFSVRTPRTRVVCPSGWAFFLYGWKYDNYVALPRQMLTPPFPRLSMGHDHKVPVPHNESEMQKYIYPNDWSTILPAPVCEQ